MTCVACTSKVEASLRGVKGVMSVSVSLITDSAEVTYDPRVVNYEQLMSAVRTLGFDVTARRDALSTSMAATSDSSTLYIDIGGVIDTRAAASVETALKSDNTVSDVSVSMGPPPKATIRYDASRAEPQRYVDAITGLGFTASVTSAPSSTSSTVVNGTEINGQEEARRRLVWALVFAIPVFLLAMVLPWIHVTRPFLLHYIYGKLTVTGLLMTILATPVQFWVGRVFIIAAFKGLRHGSFNMSVLVTLGSLAAYTVSFHMHNTINPLLCPI
jgi:Cu+-exporting ATPase